jgi:hypothetical protein
MPTAITRGAASAKAFGFTSGTGGVGYKWLGQLNGGSALYGSNTSAGLFPPTGATYISTSSATYNTVPLAAAGVIANGKVICIRTGRSENNGVSWYGFSNNGYYSTRQLANMAAGPNGGVAYDPISNTMASVNTNYDGKSNVWYINLYTINSTPTVYGQTSLVVGDSYYPGQVIFWPQVGYFYAPLFNYPYVVALNATATTGYYFSWGGYSNRQRWCVNPTTGYMYASANNAIYEVYDAGFSSYSVVGYDGYYGYPIQSVPIKGPGNYWYKAISSYNSSPQIMVSDNTNYPTGWGYIGSPSGGACQGFLQIMYDSTAGTFYFSGMFYDGKSNYTIQTVSYDGGYSWGGLSGSGNYQALVKNLK